VSTDMTCLPTVTLEQVLARRPCWPQEQIREAAGARGAWTADEVLALEDTPPADRLWVVLHPDWLPPWILRLSAADCAMRALHRERVAGREPDPRSWAAARCARDHGLCTLADAELAAAWSAARSAEAAAWSAEAGARSAWSAAWSAARSAARSAEAAAWARSPWSAAAWSAAAEAERQKQVDRLQGLLRWARETGRLA